MTQGSEMTTELPDRDRRGKSRLPIVLEVHLAWRGGDFTAFSVDLAESGIFVETHEDLSPDTEVRVRFRVPGRSNSLLPVVADGRVRRAIREGGLAGLAIRFERFVEGWPALQELIHDRVGPGDGPATPDRGEERRGAPRVNVGLPVYWGSTSPPRTTGFLRDISDTGAFVLETDDPARVGERIFLEFELPLRNTIQRVKGIAKVVRCQAAAAHAGMGIEFEYSTVDADLIVRFVAQRRALESMRKLR